MFDYLIEIVFKDLRPDKIGNLLKDLCSSNEQRIMSYNFTCESSEIDWTNSELIRSFFCNNDDFGLFINLNELKRGETCLPNCGIVVYKHDNKIDFEINFQLSDLEENQTKNLAKKLMELAKSLSVEYQIDDYFCGIEPAQDIETRLFTKEHLGPLSLEN